VQNTTDLSQPGFAYCAGEKPGIGIEKGLFDEKQPSPKDETGRFSKKEPGVVWAGSRLSGV
jgi:hypothetical protein